MSNPAPVKLHFEDSGEWYSLPEWAEYFISIGKHIAAAPQADSRTVTAIVVPTRSFGGTFVSLGMVVSDTAERHHGSEAAHFAKLLRCTPGTPSYRPLLDVLEMHSAAQDRRFYRDSDRTPRCITKGTTQENGELTHRQTV